MRIPRIAIATSIVLLFLVPLNVMASDGVILFNEDFESCIPPDFSVDNGVWDCCLHGAVAPPEGGYLYAGTVCGANYPRYTDSRLITPEIDLTGVVLAPDDEIILRFWHWFTYSGGDYGVVQISEYDENTSTWSTYDSISDPIVSTSSVWSPKNIDLTTYAGKKIKIAFFHTDNGDYSTSPGWYIDNIEVIQKSPDLTWDFECGWDDWSAGNGVWDVGIPDAGPGKAYSGDQCAGTVLDGNYPRYTDSRLISPTIVLDCAGAIRLRFRYWFSLSGGDYGVVQISTLDEANQSWSDWEDISDHIIGAGAVWSPMTIDLTAYAGKQVKLAFFHTDNGDYSTSYGLYIDNIRIDCGEVSLFPHFCDCDINQDETCNILDYQKFIQDWGRTDCGNPPGSGLLPNDCECDLNKDGSCNILDYQRFVTCWGSTSCLICE